MGNFDYGFSMKWYDELIAYDIEKVVNMLKEYFQETDD
jgi:hypothetical protein